jgi:arylsulfatase
VAEEVLPPQLFGFGLTATVSVQHADAEGAIATLGDWSNGWALYALDGHVVFALTTGGTPARLISADALSPGDHTLHVEYVREHGGGRLVLSVDGAEVDRAELPQRLPFRWQIGGAGLLVGRHLGFPVHTDYESPFPFEGTIHRVVLAVPVMAPSDADVAMLVQAALHQE